LVLESASQVAIIMTDPKGLVQIFNRGAENLTGWSADEVVNLRTPILLHDPEEIERERQGLASEGAAPADPFEALVARARNGAAHRRKWTLVTRQGGRRCLDLVITRVDDLAGHSLGFLGVGIDVTREEEAAEALRRKEEQLRHSQKMDAIGQLAGGVAHDFNNMLAGILGSTELLAASLEPGDSRAKLVKLIATASQRASDLTSKLLSFSRKGKLVSTPFSVHRIIQETLQLVQRSIGPRISIQLDLAPGEPTIVGDPSEIESALLNLCINARDAMPEGGTLTIGTALVERDGLPTLRLRVADTGTGIPEPIRQRIFEPFFTTKAQGKGTGLGLAAVYGIVQAHGGFLDLETEPGRGTAFLLDFPLDSRGAAPDPGLPGPGPTGSGTVLVVDDEDVVRATSSMLLESAGYQVILAKDGEEALRLYQDHAGRVALVLMDMIMPGIPGREAAQRIRAMDPNARFLFTSGFAGPGMMPETQASGIAGFLHKPFTRHDLLEAVARALA
jgi:PAS domain S-box-containing protein